MARNCCGSNRLDRVCDGRIYYRWPTFDRRFSSLEDQQEGINAGLGVVERKMEELKAEIEKFDKEVPSAAK